MKRRDFIKSAGLLGMGAAFGGFAPLYTRPLAAAPAYDSVSLAPVAADQLPRIINIFLYGGPSELAGNLTNMAGDNGIMANSQNPYPASFDPMDGATIVTSNGFWSTAGGDIMESLLASGDMTIYRTMHRVKEDSKAHGASVTQNLVGNLDMDSPGIATTLAWIVQQQNPFGKDVNELVFPFVTFEGESQVFNLGNIDIPIGLKPVSLNSNLQNPYQRSNIGGASYLDAGSSIDQALDALAYARNAGGHAKLKQGFEKRAELALQMGTLLEEAAVDAAIDTYNTGKTEGVDPDFINYGTGNFGSRLKAAISLMLANPETLFISLGSGGLGGWDDHSEALIDYPGRVQGLMSAIQAAVNHMNVASAAGVTHANKIIINVYGDFGRNVNLNNSMGWDHGNNQNLYTFGGKGVAGRGATGMGKIVGRTQRIGDSGVNRQFTAPTADSYQFEPFALASTIYKYYGVQNPEVLTGEPAIDENAAGETLV